MRIFESAPTKTRFSFYSSLKFSGNDDPYLFFEGRSTITLCNGGGGEKEKNTYEKVCILCSLFFLIMIL